MISRFAIDLYDGQNPRGRAFKGSRGIKYMQIEYAFLEESHAEIMKLEKKAEGSFEEIIGDKR